MAGTSWYVSACKDCISIDLKDRNKYDETEAWCNERRMYVDPNSRACSNRFENDDRKNPPSESLCYLTTITCNILGMEDDCTILNTLRKFREETLRSDPQYHQLLCEYDVVGPVISEAISKSLKPHDLASFLMQAYIQPTVICINEGKTELAVWIYIYMVEELKKLCGIKEVEYDESMIPTGKGYLKDSGYQYHL